MDIRPPLECGDQIYKVDLSYGEGFVLGCAYRAMLDMQEEEYSPRPSEIKLAKMKEQTTLLFTSENIVRYLKDFCEVLDDYREDLLTMRGVMKVNHITNRDVDWPSLDVSEQIGISDAMFGQMAEEGAVLELRAENLLPEHFS